ncbi:mitochondrial ATP synthase g subunit-domain-containing protein [Rhodofomes roseus]|uniref:Mitochondrial ATP synthase g subunit-domain-containing protein n=1 Tax=Rhodofomes roseus TaxID=34475 RepID=A0ABQ8KKT2_9APHY|nr:mitochondrial ATP synthase g subunit-domain-containing protein [Rhodofomes roseus]KAH9838757.1 mitochondrial ATP synthase g subunit-domain-containing protein [Rhodofomes roseus]
MRASVPFRLAQLRPHAHAQRRFASSTPGGGVNVNTAEAQKKAQEALAVAGKKLGQAVELGKQYMGPVGEKAGTMLGSYREPLTYNFAVAREFLKQVYVAERLQPPTSLATLQSAYSTLWSRASNPAYWRELVQSGGWTKVGVYALEAYGIFKIGEIIGRRSLVGYKVE